MTPKCNKVEPISKIDICLNNKFHYTMLINKIGYGVCS